MSLTVAALKKRVEKGAKWLDITHEKWWEKVDASILDLAEGDRCVLGQVMGNGWLFGPEFSSGNVHLSEKASVSLGLHLGERFPLARYPEKWSTLTELWLQQIKRRRKRTSN